MSELDELRQQLATSIGQVHVDEVGPDSYRVVVANHHSAHTSLALLLKRHRGGWRLSDLGHTALDLGYDFTEVADLLECAGAPVSTAGEELLLELDGRELGSSILQFAATVSAASLVRDALACARPAAKARAPQSTIVMAREARGRIAARYGPALESMFPVDRAVRGALDSVKAPLQMRTTSNSTPKLLIACVDLTAKSQSVTAAKQHSAYLWAASHNLEAQRYTIARGSSYQVDQLASVFDRASQVTVVSSGDDEALLDSIGEQLEELRLV